MNKTITLLALLLATPAFADHASWSKRNSFQSSNFYWENNMEGEASSLTADGNRESLAGVGVKAGLGTQLGGFVRLEGYGLYRALSNGSNDSVYGPTFGLDLGVTFTSPVVNLNFGLGANGTSLSRQLDSVTTKFNGQGVDGSAMLERFISRYAAVQAGFRVEHEELTGAQVKGLKMSMDTTALIMGLTLWTN